MLLFWQYLILRFGICHRRNITAYAALFSVDAYGKHIFSAKLVQMLSIMQHIASIRMYCHLKRLIYRSYRHSVFAADIDVSHACVIAVFLRIKIIVYKLFRIALPQADLSRSSSVTVILMRSLGIHLYTVDALC